MGAFKLFIMFKHGEIVNVTQSGYGCSVGDLGKQAIFLTTKIKETGDKVKYKHFAGREYCIWSKTNKRWQAIDTKAFKATEQPTSDYLYFN